MQRGGGNRTDAILAQGKVLYKGHPVAAVAASSPHVAEEAVELIEVAYEPLPSVTNVEDAVSPDAPVLHEGWDDPANAVPGSEIDSPNAAVLERHVMGDLEAGFAEADLIVEREFRTKTVHQGYIEPQNGTASWSPEGRLTIWCSSQGHFGIRDAVAGLLDIPISRLKVVPMEIGGGFGGKLTAYLEPLAALLSKKSGRPVKMTMTRAEVLEASGPTAGSHVTVKIGVTNEGRITAAFGKFLFEGGAYGGGPVAPACAAIFAPYNIENVRIDGYDIVTNKPSTRAYRAPGAPIVAFATESVIDEIAEMLDIDPMELRLLNVAREGLRRADGVMNGRIGAAEVMEAVRSHPHYSALRSRARITGAASPWVFAGTTPVPASVIANVLDDGTVSLVEGSVDIGGSRTVIAQQLAEVLGIPVEDVNPSIGDTDSIGFTSNTGGSGVAFKSGWAAHEAARDVIAQLTARAAMIWDVSPEQVRYEDGGVEHVSDTELRISFREIAAMLPDSGGPVVGRANLNPAGQSGSYSANIVDVEVDPDTGKVDILRYTAFQDVGFAIHPSYVEGQIQGGTAQGSRLGAQRGVFHERRRRDAKHEPPRLPDADDPRPSDDRHGSCRGQQPRPPLRCARRRRGEYLTAHGRARERHSRRRGPPTVRASDEPSGGIEGHSRESRLATRDRPVEVRYRAAITRSPMGWTGRSVGPPLKAIRSSTCSWETVFGWRMTYHSTGSSQGGVVFEPSYR